MGDYHYVLPLSLRQRVNLEPVTAERPSELHKSTYRELPPGGVDDEQIKIRGFGVVYGLSLKTGLEELTPIGNAAHNHTTDIIWVVTCQGLSVHHVAFNDDVTKTWRETFYLRLDGLRLVLNNPAGTWQ